MRNLLLACALMSAGLLGMQAAASAHAGTYRGPGDTVPPGGGGGGGAPGAPVTGNPGHPGSPTSPTGGPVAPSGPNGNPNSPTTITAGIQGPDLTIWQYWWGFNREPYLNLKSHIRTPSVTTGSAEFFIGQGQKDQARDLLRPSEETIRTQIVPALLRVLERETSNDIVTGALVLARIGDSSDEGGAQKSQMAEVIRDFGAHCGDEI